MKNFLFLFVTTAIFVSLSSFNVEKAKVKLIGIWQVVTIDNSSGRKKTGNRMITFSKDGTMVSARENGTKMTGSWEFRDKILRISDKSKSREEICKIIKLTKKKMILKENRKTITLIKLE